MVHQTPVDFIRIYLTCLRKHKSRKHSKRRVCLTRWPFLSDNSLLTVSLSLYCVWILSNNKPSHAFGHREPTLPTPLGNEWMPSQLCLFLQPSIYIICSNCSFMHISPSIDDRYACSQNHAARQHTHTQCQSPRITINETSGCFLAQGIAPLKWAYEKSFTRFNDLHYMYISRVRQFSGASVISLSQVFSAIVEHHVARNTIKITDSAHLPYSATWWCNDSPIELHTTKLQINQLMKISGFRCGCSHCTI